MRAAIRARSPAPASRCWSRPAATLGHPRRLQADHRPGLRRQAAATSRRWFEYLLLIVVVLALATARPLLFRLLARRAGRRRHPPRGARNLLRLAPGFFEENRPSEIASRITADTDDHRAGRRHHRLGRAAQHRAWASAASSILFVLAPKLTGMLLLGIPLVVVPIVLLGRRVRAVSRTQPGPDRRCRRDRRRDARRDEDRPGLRPGRARERALRATRSKRAFATARRRILLRALMTALVIALIFRRDHPA